MISWLNLLNLTTLSSYQLKISQSSVALVAKLEPMAMVLQSLAPLRLPVIKQSSTIFKADP